MDRADQARRNQRDRRGPGECILVALVLVGLAATTFFNLTGAASAESFSDSLSLSDPSSFRTRCSYPGLDQVL